ncbi:hypothetical protein ACQPYK_48915 (plasmid) [Streptosporangium sp. CA-135522]|uniref:hypothetical protein n=1 Tax=Streptosporangium sp. CA-135522 TaxID=3240072 RepID=UPI003D948AAA
MTTLERALTRALMEIVVGLDELSDDHKRTLVQLITDCANEETDPDRQLTAWEMPEILGLSA